jgi:hypothetical protein
MLDKDEFREDARAAERTERAKAMRLAQRPMPLLRDGQDTNGLAALVAYRLRRLGVRPMALMHAGISRDDARQLHSGSIALRAKDIVHIAAALRLEPQDLCKPLTDAEKDEWRFYRASAREVTEVWRRVAEAGAARGLTQHQLARLLGISQSVISRAVRGERKSPVLNLNDAAKIAAALEIEAGADAFLPPGNSGENVRDDA